MRDTVFIHAWTNLGVKGLPSLETIRALHIPLVMSESLSSIERIVVLLVPRNNGYAFTGVWERLCFWLTRQMGLACDRIRCTSERHSVSLAPSPFSKQARIASRTSELAAMGPNFLNCESHEPCVARATVASSC